MQTRAQWLLCMRCDLWEGFSEFAVHQGKDGSAFARVKLPFHIPLRANIPAFYRRLQLAAPLCRHSTRILYQKSHSFAALTRSISDINSCIGTLLPLFPWSILYFFFAKLIKTSAIFSSSTKTTELPRLLMSIFFQLPIKLSNVNE